MAGQQQQTSLRFLRLQHDFQTMVKTGLSCVDEQVCRTRPLPPAPACSTDIVVLISWFSLCRPLQHCSRAEQHHIRSSTPGSCCSRCDQVLSVGCGVLSIDLTPRGTQQLLVHCASAGLFATPYSCTVLLLICTYPLPLQQSESVLKEACVEFETASSEVHLQQQLEELEALILQRGLLGGDSRWAAVWLAAWQHAAAEPAPVCPTTAQQHPLWYLVTAQQHRLWYVRGFDFSNPRTYHKGCCCAVGGHTARCWMPLCQYCVTHSTARSWVKRA